jgi:hypothetical protein
MIRSYFEVDKLLLCFRTISAIRGLLNVTKIKKGSLNTFEFGSEKEFKEIKKQKISKYYFQ